MLKELTEKIRKSIPRLMELSDGCVIKYGTETEWIVSKKENEFVYIISYISISARKVIHQEDEKIEIIGHEPMLNDVLEWLDIILVDKDIHCEIKKKYIIIYPTYNDMMYDKKICKWDLTKPYLKDQSEELIKYLNNLKI